MYALFTYSQYGAMNCMDDAKVVSEFLEIPVRKIIDQIEFFSEKKNPKYRKDCVSKQLHSMVNSWPMVGLVSAPTKMINAKLR